jgi:hypothetical protein
VPEYWYSRFRSFVEIVQTGDLIVWLLIFPTDIEVSRISRPSRRVHPNANINRAVMGMAMRSQSADLFEQCKILLVTIHRKITRPQEHTNKETGAKQFQNLKFAN